MGKKRTYKAEINTCSIQRRFRSRSITAGGANRQNEYFFEALPKEILAKGKKLFLHVHVRVNETKFTASKKLYFDLFTFEKRQNVTLLLLKYAFTY